MKYCYNLHPDPKLANALAEHMGREVQRAVLLNAKKWDRGQTINIGFMNGENGQKDLFKQHAAAWLESANLRFNYVDDNDSEVRVQFGGTACYSYIGTDCLPVPKDQLTMNLGWVDPTSIMHNVGHMLGLMHGHLGRNFPYRFDEARIIKDLSGPPNNWYLEMIRANFLDPIKVGEDTETDWDKDDVMGLYVPKEWIKEGVAIEPGATISAKEKELVRSIYPEDVPPPPVKTLMAGQQVSGTAPDTWQLNIAYPGLYYIRTSPRGITVTIDGRQAGLLVTLGPGLKTLSLFGSGPYNLVVNRW